MSRQAVTGFKVLKFTVKKAKETEILQLSLEADIENIGAGGLNMGDVLRALLHHQTGDYDIGIAVEVDGVGNSD